MENQKRTDGRTRDIFRLTTREDIVTYLEGKKLKLEDKLMNNIGKELAGMFGVVGGVGILTTDMYGIKGAVAIGSIVLGACLMENGLATQRLCEYQIDETEKKIGWIKEGNFVKESLLELQEEVLDNMVEDQDTYSFKKRKDIIVLFFNICENMMKWLQMSRLFGRI